MKKTILLFVCIVISLLFGGYGCAPAGAPAQPSPSPSEQTALTNKVRFYDIPDGVERYEGAEVTVGGHELPMYSVMVNLSQYWTANNYKRAESGVGLFELEGSATVVVRPRTQLNYASKLRPLSAKITPIADLENNTLTFTIKSAGEYVLEINGNTAETIHFFVSEYDGEEESDGDYTNEMVFAAGLHTAANDSRISSGNLVRLTSNTSVILEDGAVVRAKFIADGQSHIRIAGRGIIDGSAFERDAVAGTVTVPLEFNDCSDVTLRQFTVLDPAGWCVNFYFVENSYIDDVKIITSRSNGDGISLQSCKNVTVDGCFVRTWDDSLVVKNYPRWSNRNVHGATENIVFTNCTIWTDLAQSMEIGYETVGEKLENVRFSNITVLHALHYAPISIHNANNAQIKDILFEDVTVEDAATPSQTVGIIDIRVLFSETWSTNHATTALGSIDGVTVCNLNVLSARYLSVTVGGCVDNRAGYESEHYVSNLTLCDVAVAGERPSLDDCKVKSTGYTQNFTLTQSGEVTGATFLSSMSEEEAAQYGTECEVNFVPLA